MTHTGNEMALVTDTLIAVLRKQVEAHGTVAWFDPERVYKDVAQSLEPEVIEDAHIQRYDSDRGFIHLRRQLERLWQGTQPPRLIIYIPVGQSETQHALIEFEEAGVVVRPGQHPPEQNTSLAHIARRALESVFPQAALEDIIAQVEAGQLSLAELDEMADRGAEAQAGALAVVFGTGNITEIALQFLTKPELDAEIESRDILGDLAGSLSAALGMPFPADQGPTALRAQLARQVLVTDFIEGLEGSLPGALSTVSVASSDVARQAAVKLAEQWRNRRDLAGSYVQWADRVQVEFGIGSLELELDALSRAETFAAAEVLLQTRIESALLERSAAPLVQLAETRRDGFWSRQRPEIKTRWDVIDSAARTLAEARRVESGLAGKRLPATTLLSKYAYGDDPWCDLDTAQRHLERDFHHFELDPHQHDSLIRLVAKARQRYAGVSDTLATSFTEAYANAQFELPNVLLQTDIYPEMIEPALSTGRVAYILVDALRYEMARELLPILDDGWDHELAVALATPPTITEVGMAALLPGATNGLTVVPAGGNKLASVVEGKTLKIRQDRLNYLEERLADEVAITKLDQLAPLSDLHLGQRLESVKMTVVTATEEIDTLCEQNPALARRIIDDVLNQLRRGIKTLFRLGFDTVVVSADHGYLFGEEISSGQRIDAPGGDTKALKRRVWVGRGGQQIAGTLRKPLSAFGIGGDLELVTPKNLSCFKAPGGSTEYFHGGLSLPEMTIPVLTVRPGVGRQPSTVSPIRWVLTLGKPTISTRFLSVTIEGEPQELLPIDPPLVRVEVRAGDRPISVPVSASYGFQEATKDIQLQLEPDTPSTIAKNTVSLMIAEEPSVDEVTVHLLDATTGVSLARREHVPFAIVL